MPANTIKVVIVRFRRELSRGVTYKIDYKHNVAGVRIQFSSGQDLYEFIIRQPEFEWEIIPKIGTINSLNGEFQNFDLVYQPTGFSVA